MNITRLKNGILLAPGSFWAATDEERACVCNGAGPRGYGWAVPDTIWGLSITAAADIHDWMYNEGRTRADKDQADQVFLTNLTNLVNQAAWCLRWLRNRRAKKYYLAVKIFGWGAFKAGKEAVA